MHERLALEMDLRQALRDDLLVLHYQPQFSLDTQQLVGMEALMRWQRTPDQLVMPLSFIPVAEECGLIVDMGAWAILHAARQVALWLRAGLQPVPLAVNISARQCLNRDLVQVVRLALQETGIPPQLLRLEITETTAMSDADQVIGLLHDIRALGVLLAVDDFGTGYSSLAYLKRFPIDELKIDRTFVSDLATDKDNAAIVRATIALAHGLGLKVVAEGVETEAQRRFLAEQRCDTVQGYLFGRPQPVDTVTGWL
jgi:EAL domain-containing protein (putative c-di-GMP-specific phosphodiesterase class I)